MVGLVARAYLIGERVLIVQSAAQHPPPFPSSTLSWAPVTRTVADVVQLLTESPELFFASKRAWRRGRDPIC